MILVVKKYGTSILLNKSESHRSLLVIWEKKKFISIQVQTSWLLEKILAQQHGNTEFILNGVKIVL